MVQSTSLEITSRKLPITRMSFTVETITLRAMAPADTRRGISLITGTEETMAPKLTEEDLDTMNPSKANMQSDTKLTI